MNKRYWLRGAVIGLVVIVVFNILFSQLANNICWSANSCWWLEPILQLILSLDFIYYFIDESPIAHAVTIWPSYILIGTVLGIIYGRIKNRYKQ